MTTIGSGIAGSVAATPLASQSRAQQADSEHTEEAAQSRNLRRMSDVQQHEVENTGQSELNTILPDERRQRRRRKNGQERPEDEAASLDLVELQSVADADKPPAAPAPPRPEPPPPAAHATGRILDIEA